MHALVAILLASILALAAAPPAVSIDAQSKYRDDSDMAEREEIRQSYELAPGARVEVSTISGSVDVETTNGQMAEVHIIRMGKTRKDFDCYKINIEHSPNSLILRHEQGRDEPCHNIQSRQRVTLKLPRNVELKLNAISGPVTVGEIDGAVRLSGISGKVEVAQALGYSDISGISGVLSMNITRVSERGVRISGISGRVEIRAASGLNADLRVSGINGDINNDAPNVSITKTGHSQFSGRIGSGGAPISVSGISGSVVFQQSSAR